MADRAQRKRLNLAPPRWKVADRGWWGGVVVEVDDGGGFRPVAPAEIEAALNAPEGRPWRPDPQGQLAAWIREAAAAGRRLGYHEGRTAERGGKPCPFCGGGEAPGPAPAPGPGPDRRPPGGRGGAAMSRTFEEGQKRPCTAISHPGRGLSPDRALETGAAEPGRRGAVPGAPIGVDAGDVRNALDELAAGAPG